MLNWLTENWAILIVIAAFGYVLLHGLKQDFLRNRFKKKFLPLVEDFYRRYPDYVLRAAGDEILLLHRDRPNCPFLMWNPHRLSEPAGRLPQYIYYGDFEEPAKWLEQAMSQHLTKSEPKLTGSKRAGLIASIRQYEHDQAKQQRQKVSGPVGVDTL